MSFHRKRLKIVSVTSLRQLLVLFFSLVAPALIAPHVLRYCIWFLANKWWWWCVRFSWFVLTCSVFMVRAYVFGFLVMLICVLMTFLSWGLPIQLGAIPTSCLNASVRALLGPHFLQNGSLIFGIVCLVTLLIFPHLLHLSARLNVSISVSF